MAPTDRRFGASHMIWAEALVGQHKYEEALPHAQTANKLLQEGNGISPGAKMMNAEAHQVLMDVQAKLAQGGKSSPANESAALKKQ